MPEDAEVVADENRREVKRWKLWLSWLLVFIAAVAASTLAHYVPDKSSPVAGVIPLKWWSKIPFDHLAIACWVILGVAFIYEWFLRRESVREIHEALFQPRVIKEVLALATVEATVRAGLQRLTGDDHFGKDLFEIVRNNFGADRRYEALTSIVLHDLKPGSTTPEIVRECFQATVVYEFRRKIAFRTMRFLCVDSADEYNDSYDSRNIEWRWENPRSALFPHFDENFYDVEALSLDDSPLELKTRMTAKGDIEYFASIPQRFTDGKSHKIRYVLHVKVERFGHHMRIEVREPTKGIRIRFDCAETDIDTVSVIELFSSNRKPTRVWSPTPNSKNKRVEVTLEDDWVIPQSGVGFIWQLGFEKNRLRQPQEAPHVGA